MRKILCLFVIVMALTNAVARAEVHIDTDFDTSSAGWTQGGANHLAVTDVGGSYGAALADTTPSGGLWSYNTTRLPLYMSVDLDYMITNPTSTDPLVIGLHVWGSQADPLSPVTGPLQDHNGYFVVFTGGIAPPQQRIQIQRRGGPNPEDLTVLADEQYINDDLVPHHLRITDCGCGRLTVFVDNMASPVLYTDNKFQYIGRTGTLLGVGMPGGAAGWIDNVFVEGDPVSIPEPATACVLAIGALAGLRRRR